MRLSQVGELGLLAELERRGLAQRIENDAAQLEDGLVVTQDALVEGVHFRFDLVLWRDLGFRAAAVNLSDLAASGAEPEALVVTLAVPSETELEDVLELYAGLNEPGVPIVGGDTTRADLVALSVTALGRSERVPGRGGARPGDLLVLTGPLGAAGAAFRNGRLARPPLRLSEGRPGQSVFPEGGSRRAERAGDDEEVPRAGASSAGNTFRAAERRHAQRHEVGAGRVAPDDRHPWLV